MSGQEGLIGLGELNIRLDDMDDTMAEAAARGLAQACLLISGRAKELAPVGDGYLRNSIHTQVEREDERVVGQVIAGAEYGVYVEFGTGPVGNANHAGTAPIGQTYTTRPWVYYDPKRGSFFTTSGQPARPFMYPAFLENREEANDLIQAALKQGAKEV